MKLNITQAAISDKIMLLFVLVLGFLLSRGATQAPGDESALCPQTYPDTWRVLMDSWRYLDLLHFYGAVWTECSVDGDQRTWGPGSGGLCRWSISSCFYALGTQNNWVFTQHISKDIPAGQHSNYPVKVYVNITYIPVNCASGCIQRFDAYHYIVNTPQTTATQKDTSRYSLLQGIHTSGSQEDLKVLELDLSQSQNGLYFAFQDPDTCITINRVIVYRKICPERQDGLVLYSETPAPLAQTRSFQASCVPNARQHPTSSLSVTCTYEGEWVGSPQCQCNGGYRSNGSACEACPAGTYSTNPPSTSCSSCPANTVTTEVAASICSCLDGFYRASGETADNDCTSPPTAVTSLTVASTTDTTATLSWVRPAITGRNDFYYVISHSDPDGPDFIVFNNMYVNPSTTVTLTVTGLEPATRYMFRIATANGVSDLNPDGAPLRLSEISDTTDEGISGPPTGVQNICTVVIWREPVNPNGKITGYRVRFSRGSSRRVVFGIKAENEPYHVISPNDLPSGTATPTVQVRAINSAGYGQWSDEVTIDDLGTPTPPVQDPTPPDRVVIVGVFEDTVVWDRPDSNGADLTRYELRFYRSGQASSASVWRVNDPSQRWYRPTQSNLPTGTPVRVQARAVNSVGNGLWSSEVTFCSSAPCLPSPPSAPDRVVDVRVFEDTVVWDCPDSNGADLTRYELRFYRSGQASSASVLRLNDPSQHWYRPTQSNLPTGTPVRVQVRAVNSVGNGQWSSEVTFCSSPPCLPSPP